MPPRLRVFSSSVGTKLLIGITGLALFGYLLILIELLLLLVFLIHIYKTVRMFLGNQAARPVGYVKKQSAGYTTRKSFASTTMIVSGLWLLVFIVIHAKTFRDGWGHQYEWAPGGRDLYRQEMETFSSPLVVGFYVLTMAIVGSHLWHGLGSALQSLGIVHEKWTPRFLVIGKALAVLIAGAFMAIAIWAYMRQAGTVHV